MQTALQPGAFYSVQEIADVLGVSRSHVWRLIRQQELRGVNIGGGARPRFRVSGADLLAFLERRGAMNGLDEEETAAT